MDKVMASGVVLGILLFIRSALTTIREAHIIAGTLCGVAGISLLSGYTVQLAINGPDWWQCVQEEWPDQALGFSGCAPPGQLALAPSHLLAFSTGCVGLGLPSLNSSLDMLPFN